MTSASVCPGCKCKCDDQCKCVPRLHHAEVCFEPLHAATDTTNASVCLGCKMLKCVSNRFVRQQTHAHRALFFHQDRPSSLARWRWRRRGHRGMVSRYRYLCSKAFGGLACRSQSPRRLLDPQSRLSARPLQLQSRPLPRLLQRRLPKPRVLQRRNDLDGRLRPSPTPLHRRSGERKPKPTSRQMRRTTTRHRWKTPVRPMQQIAMTTSGSMPLSQSLPHLPRPCSHLPPRRRPARWPQPHRRQLRHLSHCRQAFRSQPSTAWSASANGRSSCAPPRSPRSGPRGMKRSPRTSP